MRDDVDNKISQFLDDELDQQQALNLLKSLQRDKALKQKLVRYQLVSQVIKTRQPAQINVCIVDRVRQQIEKEPVQIFQRRPESAVNSFHWRKTTLALAASLAVVAIMLPGIIKDTGPGSSSTLIADSRQAPPVTVEQVAKNRPLDANKQNKNQRFKDYLYAHSNRMYTVGASASMPYVQTAGFRQGQ